MRWIYVSPHLDDAVLSAGGLIYEQTRAGLDVEIWTTMCGFPAEDVSPFAQMLHHQWGIAAAADLVNARRAEDAAAAKIVGAEIFHFDFLDCIYRRGKNGDWLYESNVFIPPHEDDTELSAQIAEAIAARLKPDDKLVCQFGVGSHLDHIVVRRAVEMLARPIFYDADIPYHFRAPEELAQHIVDMNETIYPVGEPALKAWQDGIAEYKSQVGGLFESLDEMRIKVKQYKDECGGIRFWSRKG